MKKSELQTGMVVEVRNGSKLLVLRGKLTSQSIDEDLLFIGQGYYFITDKIKEDLIFEDTKGCDIVKVYIPKNFTALPDKLDDLDLIWERKEVDWSKVPVDTKVLVMNEGNKYWRKRHFKKYEAGKYYTFNDGKTSFTNTSNMYWNKCVLYEGNEYLVEEDEG